MNRKKNISNTNSSEPTELNSLKNINKDNTDTKQLNRESGETDKSSSKINQEKIRTKKDTDSEDDTKREQTNENQQGLLHRIGCVFSNTFERAKEIIFPDLEERHESSTKEETNNEDLIDEEKSNPIERENQGVQCEEKRPKIVMSEAEKDFVGSSSFQTSKDNNLPETDIHIPYSESPIVEKKEDDINKSKTLENFCFNEQPKEELSTPINKEVIQPIAQGDLDEEKIRDKLQALDLNREEQNFDLKEQAINNQNFNQDISNVLQYGDKAAQEETSTNEKKIPNWKDNNKGKINLIIFS